MARDAYPPPRMQTADDVLPPPAKLDAERSILCACLNDRASLESAVTLLQPTDFYDKRHELAFATLASLFRQGVDVDALAVTERLDREHNGFAPDLPYLLSLQGFQPGAPLHLERRCLEVAKLGEVRRIGDTLRHLSIDSMGARDTADEWLDRTRSECARIASGAVVGKSVAIEPHAQAKQWEQWRREDLRVCPTGIGPVDRKLGGGLYATELVILGARTRVGKTALGVQMLATARKHGWNCMMFSCEMRPLELQMRYASSLTGIPLELIRSKALDEGQWGIVDRAAKKWIDLAVPVVYGVHTVSVLDRELALRPKCDFVLLDYLQKYRPPEGQRYGVREQEVAAVAGALKDIAMRRNIVMLATAQLNREAEKGGDDRLPVIADLRESGAIEQDANSIMLLHRSFTGHDRMAATLVLAKNRSGGEQIAKLRMTKSYTFAAEANAREEP